jgi:ribosomal protein S18 acetylase RimI-like enzyme
MNQSDFVICPAKISGAENIQNLLWNSFEPYRKFYPKEAFHATVISKDEIIERIKNPEISVLVALLNEKIVGTASIYSKNQNCLHIATMAVNPNFQKKGIGYQILEFISDIARKNNVLKLSLETSRPLKRAIAFYKKYGFVKTGKKRDYFGIEVFELIKEVNL